jgi:DNA-binding MarR family transcriptional regulator
MIIFEREGVDTMIQGMQRKVLETIADIEHVTCVAEVEDVEIADETGLDIRLIRTTLDILEKAGYINLEKVKTIAGPAYSAFLTGQGKGAVADNRSPMSEKQ